MGLPIENLRHRWIDPKTGECANENDRPCGAKATEFFQACVPKEVGCPIRKFQIVRKTEEIEKYAKDVVEDYETNGTDLGGTVTQVSEHSPILEEDPDPKDIPTIETYEGNSQENRSFSGGVDWRNS